MVENKVVVIGAGMAGLTAAYHLQKAGFIVQVLEKARGSGGRMSSKSVPFSVQGENKKVTFDLGCSSFRVTDQRFKDFLFQSPMKQHVQMLSEFSNEFVGVPRNSALTRSIAASLDVEFSTRITKMTKVNHLWQLITEAGQSVWANQVVLAAPSKQSRELLPIGHSLLDGLEAEQDRLIAPQWVAGVVLATELTEDVKKMDEDLLDSDSIIESISVEHAKPQRSEQPVLQVQTKVSWSEANLELNKEKVAEEIWQALQIRLPRLSAVRPLSMHVHRWLYSHVDKPVKSKPLTAKGFLASKDGLSICGDYCYSTQKYHGIESAFLSGLALSQYLIDSK